MKLAFAQIEEYTVGPVGPISPVASYTTLAIKPVVARVFVAEILLIRRKPPKTTYLLWFRHVLPAKSLANKYVEGSIPYRTRGNKLRLSYVEVIKYISNR